MTSEPAEIAELRAQVDRLERQRDEIAQYLKALSHERPPPKRHFQREPAPPSPVEPWVFAPRSWLWLPVSLGLLLVTVLVDTGPTRYVVFVLLVVLAASGLWLTVRPPRLTLDERGLSVRYMLGTTLYAWDEVTDFVLPAKRAKLLVEAGGTWHAHRFTPGVSVEREHEAQRRVKAWINAHGHRR